MTTALNTAPLREVLAHIEAHPEEHDQNVYGERTAGGTTACVAGHLLIRAPEWEADWTIRADSAILDWGRRRADRHVFCVETAAKTILGAGWDLHEVDYATWEEADAILAAMFESDVGIQEIHALARKFYALAGEPE